MAWEIADDNSTTAVAKDDEYDGKRDATVKCYHQHFITTSKKIHINFTAYFLKHLIENQAFWLLITYCKDKDTEYLM